MSIINILSLNRLSEVEYAVTSPVNIPSAPDTLPVNVPDVPAIVPPWTPVRHVKELLNVHADVHVKDSPIVVPFIATGVPSITANVYCPPFVNVIIAIIFLLYYRFAKSTAIEGSTFVSSNLIPVLLTNKLTLDVPAKANVFIDEMPLDEGVL